MDEARLTTLLVDLHHGLDRLGPGDRASTLQALALCSDLPETPDVLDVGCGTGAATLVLADALSGAHTATDLFPPLLETADGRFRSAGIADRARTLQADMRALPFPNESFDLVWCEGAAYIMGFDAALTSWRRLLRPGGYLVVTEASWFQDDPPAELAEFWAEGYPAMRSVEENLDAAREQEYEVQGCFPLPDEAWTQGYYGPLGERLESFAEKHGRSAEAEAVVGMTRQEVDLFNRYSAFYGYAFYVLRARQA
jgi:ubiquinone/menaquinone biosynthesis C-methylase UbiE